MSFHERFEKHIDKTDDCWLWKSAVQGKYGVFWYESKQILAHRMSYIINNGEITNGLIVRHKCKSKLCVNPEHLETGTLKQNSQDRWRDGTMNTKLTLEQVQLIRASDKSSRELSEELKMNYSTIYRIRNYKTWNHIS